MTGYLVPGAARWRRIWDTWLIVTAGSFAILEGMALRTTGERATLTCHLRRALGVHPYRPRWGACGRALVVAVLGWLLVHLSGDRWPRDGWLDPKETQLKAHTLRSQPNADEEQRLAAMVRDPRNTASAITRWMRLKDQQEGAS